MRTANCVFSGLAIVVGIASLLVKHWFPIPIPTEWAETFPPLGVVLIVGGGILLYQSITGELEGKQK